MNVEGQQTLSRCNRTGFLKLDDVAGCNVKRSVDRAIAQIATFHKLSKSGRVGLVYDGATGGCALPPATIQGLPVTTGAYEATGATPGQRGHAALIFPVKQAAAAVAAQPTKQDRLNDDPCRTLPALQGQ